MYDSRLSRHYHIWNDEFSERPERLTEPYAVCQKYKLVERCKEIKVLQGFSYRSEVGTWGLLNLGKKHLDHQNWGKLILYPAP